MNAREAKELLGKVNRWSTVVVQRMSHIVEHHCEDSAKYNQGSYFTDDTGTALTSNAVVQTYGAKVCNMLQERQLILKQDPRNDPNTFLVAKQLPPRTGSDPRARNLRRGDLPARGAQGPVTYGGDVCHWLVCVVKKNSKRGPREEPLVVTTAYPATQLYVQGLKAMG